MDCSVAIVHKHYDQRGGEERVVEALARTFDAPVYVGYVRQEALPADEGIEIHELFGDRLALSLARRAGPLREFYYQLAWQHVPELAEYDVLIQSGNSPGWYVPRDEQVIIRYVHSPQRTAYDLAHRQRGTARLFAHLLRLTYLQTLPYPDTYVANSELVARRVERYWGIEDVAVVYPPVDVDSYAPGEREEFYLAYSRLASNKRFDEIIDAFAAHPDKRLVIGGRGPEGERLRERARGLDNVEFHGYLSTERKRELLGSAKALVYAAESEDFGIVPIEALASGTPVIGVREGFTKYQLTDGETGILYDRGPDSLATALDRFEREGVSADTADLTTAAERYGFDRFAERMDDVVSDAVERAAVEVG